MFSFFKLFKGKPAAPTVAAKTSAQASGQRMTLEERKAFRQEMLYQSIRASFLSMEVLANMYKFKVMAVDERHHRFIAMIDVAKSFVTCKDSRTKSFSVLEQTIRADAFKRFGIRIDGTYWRVSETEEQFERYSRVGDKPGAVHAPKAQPAVSEPAAARKPLARQAYQPVSDAETVAFMAALSSGKSLPAVRVGEREYQSDLMPLDDGIMIGGTQYGKLE